MPHSVKLPRCNIPHYEPWASKEQNSKGTKELSGILERLGCI